MKTGKIRRMENCNMPGHTRFGCVCRGGWVGRGLAPNMPLNAFLVAPAAPKPLLTPAGAPHRQCGPLLPPAAGCCHPQPLAAAAAGPQHHPWCVQAVGAGGQRTVLRAAEGVALCGGQQRGGAAGCCCSTHPEPGGITAAVQGGAATWGCGTASGPGGGDTLKHSLTHALCMKHGC